MPRRYGQHFLTDRSIVERIVESSGMTEDDAVLEIGPGRGILTRALADAAGRVLAVEIDRRLFSELRDAGLPENVEVRIGDILRTDLGEIEDELGPGYHVVANLPYDITTDVLKKLLRDPNGPATLTVMVQKEVGERIAEKDGKASRLSLFCGYYSETAFLFTVPKGAFSPPPKVDSAVIRLSRHAEPLLTEKEEVRFFALTEAAFSEKRKKIANTIRKILGAGAETVLRDADIDPHARPEEIPLGSWLTLAREK